MTIVSACLIGLCTRYDGSSATAEEAVCLMESAHAIPVCPEQLAGLPTPRPRSTLSGGDGRQVSAGSARFLTQDNKDMTDEVVRACRQIAALAKAYGAKTALLKEGSPSCGVKHTNLNWQREAGMGVLAAILASEGIEVKGM